MKRLQEFGVGGGEEVVKYRVEADVVGARRVAGRGDVDERLPRELGQCRALELLAPKS